MESKCTGCAYNIMRQEPRLVRCNAGDLPEWIEEPEECSLWKERETEDDDD